MKALATAVCLFLGGCAVVDVEEPTGSNDRTFEPIVNEGVHGPVKHGVVVVERVVTRSDVAIIPPDNQHVVWVSRPLETKASIKVDQEVFSSTRQVPSPVSKVGPDVKDRWPLLSTPLDFSTEYGRVDMCEPKEGCERNDCAGAYEPCVGPGKYNCLVAKPGEYCVEDEF